MAQWAPRRKTFDDQNGTALSTSGQGAWYIPLRRWCFLIIWASVLWAPTAFSGDGAIQWRTLSTKHFRIHYPSHLKALASRAAYLCEEAYDVLTPLLNYQPSTRMDVSLTDFGDDANGSATAIPVPRLSLFAAPPRLDGNLGDHIDWLRLLIFHEFTHILQLDRVRGVPEILNSIFGRIFVPNQNLPSFQLEGGAVWAESYTGGYGRIRSALFSGFLRAQALSGTLHDLDRMTHVPPHWPDANIWYMYGGYFIDWVTRNHGPQWMGILHDEIADDLVPFGINRAARVATGVSLASLYRRWQNAVVRDARRVAADVARAGSTPYTRLSTTGRNRHGLQFDTDGSLLNIETVRSPTAVVKRALDAGANDSPQQLFEITGLRDFHVCPGGQWAVFTRSTRYGGAYSTVDLYRWHRKSNNILRLTRRGRVREIACAPSGRWVAATQIHDGGTRLVRVDIKNGRQTVLFTPSDTGQIAFPTFTTDGKNLIATQVGRTFGRDLIRLELETGAVHRLTNDVHLELNPSITPDGQHVVYAADGGGIFNIYRMRLKDRRIEQLTRMTTGATHPAVDPTGKVLSFRLIGPHGYDVAIMPLRVVPVAQSKMATPGLLREPSQGATTIPMFKDAPYQPTDRLWPLSWSPSLSFSSATDLASILGMEIESSDPLGHHVFLGTLNTIAQEAALGTSLTYANRRFIPTYSASVSHRTQTRENAAFYGLERQPFREKLTVGSVAMTLPLRLASWSVSSSLRYSLSTNVPTDNIEPSYDPLDPAPQLPETTRAASIAASISLGSTERFFDSISTESGWTASASIRLRRPELGGEYETGEFFWNTKTYVPLWRRHVLALSMKGAFGRGDGRQRVAYGLGPPAERNVFFDALDEISMGAGYLRGYPANTAVGNRYVLAKAEYRLPLLDVFAGFDTIPLFLQRLKLSIFTDWAQASYDPLAWKLARFYRSVGVELVTQSTIAWRLPVSIRLGYSKGFLSAGEDQIYFFLGRWF
jgi:hypothetical protein